MSLIRTRRQVMDRLIADRQERPSATSTYSLENVRRYLDQAWRTIWRPLTDGGAGFGIAPELVFEAAQGNTIDLPADFLSLLALARSYVGGTFTYPVSRTMWSEVKAKQLDRLETLGGLGDGLGEYSGYFLFETPVGAQGAPASQRLRFFPELRDDKIEIIYVTQAPSLANADGTYTGDDFTAEDDSLLVDFYDENLLEVCVSLARSRLANRADSKDYQLALTRMGDLVQVTIDSRLKQDQGPPIPLSAYVTSTRWGVI